MNAPRSKRSPATMTRSRKYYSSVHAFPKPTVAMIRGYCMGAVSASRSAATFGLRRITRASPLPAAQARARLRISPG